VRLISFEAPITMGMKVLIADDDPMALKLLEHHLAGAGYEIVTATNGRDALHVVQEDGPAMIISDLHMPELNGLELCRHIRGFEGYQWTYIILLTGHGDESAMLGAFEAGADDYLTKPFNKRELLARLRAGERIVQLEQDLATKTRQIFRSKAELEIAYQRIAKANERLVEMARTDDLTGLANRLAGMATLHQFWRESCERRQPLACIMIDIDHFKHINDTRGHGPGDTVLAQTGQAIRDCARRGEQVFRFGGEEFLVLCPGATAAMAAVAAERFRRTVEELAIERDSLTLRLTISLGVSERSREMEDADEMLKAADDALYAAKHHGRNTVRIAPTAPHPLAADEDPPDIDAIDAA
jgi:diguanylate cyclase (GGDEF)-like protein